MRPTPPKIARARTLRARLSLPEALLWREIRAAGNPVHLRRQSPVASLTVDFACRAARLAIEVDGAAYHDERLDAARDARLAAEGWTVLRLPAATVLADPESAALAVLELCRERLVERARERTSEDDEPQGR